MAYIDFKSGMAHTGNGMEQTESGAVGEGG